MTDDLTAAVARLREDACTPAKVPEKDHVVLVRTADIRTVLAALAAAQADARRARECVRAADGLRAECDQVPPMVQQRNVLHAYDAARAKVTLP